MDTLNRDVLLGCIGGGTVLSLATWLLTYGTMTHWQVGDCTNGWLSLGGFAIGVAAFPMGYVTSYYFERRAQAREGQRRIGTVLDAGIEVLGTVQRLRQWWRKPRA